MKHITSKEEFYELIKKDKVIIDFYNIEKLSQEYTDIEFVKVNTDEFLELAEEYKILSIPALKVFEKGKVVKESVGLLSKQELLELLDK